MLLGFHLFAVQDKANKMRKQAFSAWLWVREEIEGELQTGAPDRGHPIAG